MPDVIKVEGLNQAVRALKKFDADAPKTLRLAFNDAAQLVIDVARPRVPTRTGKAKASIKARSLRTAVRVSEGGARAPYMPFLDFGGRVGKNKSVHRPFLKEGRYIWWAFAQRRSEVLTAAQDALTTAARAAGLEVG
jgi:hypothetical protein